MPGMRWTAASTAFELKVGRSLSSKMSACGTRYSESEVVAAEEEEEGKAVLAIVENVASPLFVAVVAEGDALVVDSAAVVIVVEVVESEPDEREEAVEDVCSVLPFGLLTKLRLNVSIGMLGILGRISWNG
eukprot:6186406-Pleurochrysis_carterae.AAC.1